MSRARSVSAGREGVRLPRCRCPAARLRRMAAVWLAAGAVLGAAYSNGQTRPVVSIAAASERVSEGADIVLTATLSRPSASAVTVALTANDRYSALAEAAPAEFRFAADETEATVAVGTGGNTVEDGAREVEFALVAAADTAGALLGTPSSLSVWVDDDDAPPGPPRNIRATVGAGAVTLSWDAPAPTSGGRIGKYQYRQSRNGGTTWYPGWIDVGGGADATEVVVGELVAGTEYTFEMRAVSSAAGNGAVSARTAAMPLADARPREEQ